MVSGQLPPEKNCPLVRLEFGSRLGLVLGLGGQPGGYPLENCPPVRVRGWVRVSFGVGGAIFLGGNCSRTLFYIQ